MNTRVTASGALPSILTAAGVPVERVATVRELTGGTYNQVTELVLDDGERLVLKVPPPAARAGLAHERDLLRGEVEFCAAARDAPAPRVVAACTDTDTDTGPFLLMTAVPGSPWHEMRPHVEAAAQEAMRTELGTLVAGLHAVRGHGYGYPSGALGPLAPSWREAFSGMLGAVLDDARRYRAWLPRPADDIARTAAAAYGALDEVTRACLVHFDLWEGNILVEAADGGHRVGGVIDGERMFWGDPLADFVSLALLGDIERDRHFLAGYRAGGGTAVFDRSARLRLALYRCYLYVIMLVELVPRGASADHRAWARQQVAPELIRALDQLAAA